MRLVRWVLVAAVFVALLVGGWRFAADNSQVVTIHYLLGQFEGVSIWLALLCAFAAGAVVVGLLGTVGWFKLRLEARRYRKAVQSLEAEVHQLRNLPLTAEEADVSEPRGELASLGGPERGS
jgi:uncharacterized membrane protein YciS (DUF1049 family)